MADLAFQFSTNGIDPRYASVGGLPIGKHMVVLTSAEWTPTKDGAGNMLVLTATCVDGPSKGETQQDRLNLQNPNQQASSIAQKQLAAYCVVCNRPQGIQQMMSEIFNQPFLMEIGPQKGAEAQAKGYCEVKAIYFANGYTVDGKPPSGGAPQMQQAPGPQTMQPGPGPQQGPGPQAFGAAPGPGPQGPQAFQPGGGAAGPTAFPPNGGQPGPGPQAPGPQAPGPQGGFPQQGGGFPQQGGAAPFQPGPGGAAPWGQR